MTEAECSHSGQEECTTQQDQDCRQAFEQVQILQKYLKTLEKYLSQECETTETEECEERECKARDLSGKMSLNIILTFTDCGGQAVLHSHGTVLLYH